MIEVLLNNKELELFKQELNLSTFSRQEEIKSISNVKRDDNLLIFTKANGRTITYNICRGIFV